MVYDAVVIGGGVIGAAVIRELSRYGGNFALLEKEEDLCSGTSKANSAIVHAGFDARPGTLMAKMNVEGNRRMDEICRELDVPFKRCGAMVLSFREEDNMKLTELRERGIKNGVEGLAVLTRDQALKLEPNLADAVSGALWAPSSGVICPFELCLGYGENAAKNGAEFFFNTPVTNVEKTAQGYLVYCPKAAYETRTVINCAGVYADMIHNMVCENHIRIHPRRGQYILCDKEVGALVSHTLFQLPTALGKGILVSPTVHGNLLLGPTAEDTENREGTDTTAQGLATVLQKAALSVKNLPTRQAITSFSGLRAHTEADEFILEESESGFFEAAGIESPGLSSAPAIGVYMAGLVAKKLALSLKTDFDPLRKAVIKADSLPFSERARLIAEEPAYGQIICRCEMISEGEILSAIHRPLGAKTLDGIKRRTRAGMGRCQSGFCSPRVMEILARELGQSLTDIHKNNGDSPIVLEKTEKGGRGIC